MQKWVRQLVIVARVRMYLLLLVPRTDVSENSGQKLIELKF